MIITLDGWNGSGKTLQANALHDGLGFVPINYFKSVSDKAFVPLFDERNDMSDDQKVWFDMCFGRLTRLVLWKSRCVSYGGRASIEHFFSDALDVVHHFKWSTEVRDFVFEIFDRILFAFFPKDRLHHFYIDVPVSILPERRPHERYGDRLKYEAQWKDTWRWLADRYGVVWVDGTLKPEHVTQEIYSHIEEHL